MEAIITLNQYLIHHLSNHPEQKELVMIMSDIATIGKFISRETNRAGLVDVLGMAGRTNIQGEQVQKLDVLANEQCKNYLRQTLHFSLLASEEDEQVVDMGELGKEAKYIIAFDPLDGSSNIDVNVSIGTIFSVMKRRYDVDRTSERQFYQKGRDQVLAGYLLYGSSTVLVFSFGNGVYEFTLDTSYGEFILSREDIKVPNDCEIYSVNEGNARYFSEKDRKFIDYLKSEKKCGSRYIGSFVADFHRNLLKGGIFMYPAMDKKGDGNYHGKLRLNYELKPLAFILEQAGGLATDGSRNILDIVPEKLHQRCPVLMGNKEVIEKYFNFYLPLTSHMTNLNQIAKQMVARGKGILAADESTGTIGKRFAKINVENIEANRRSYRELLFTAPNFNEFISGVILYDETIRQRANDGHTFVTILENQGILPGIKVDEGIEAMHDSPNEVVTKGLEGLPNRLPEYEKMGAKFCKWRAVIKIGENIPTDNCIKINAERLAKYAKLCQENNLVPIVEPEVLMDGAHTIETCYEVTRKTLAVLFTELKKAEVDLAGIILKPNMVISGIECLVQASAKQVAELTIKCFKETVPAEVPGIAFLSGGQSEAQACETLNEINKIASDCPWQLSFSYGRALQASALKAWEGKAENTKAGQEALLNQAKQTSLAREGKL